MSATTAKQTLTATLPDGTTVKRTTKADYTHVVAVLSLAADREAAGAAAVAQFRAWGQDERADKRQAEIAADVALGDVWGVWGWASGFERATKTRNVAARLYATVKIVPVN